MDLSAPGQPWYLAYLDSITTASPTAATAHFQVYDASANVHNGLATDGVTVQPLLDVAFNPSDAGNLRTLVQEALQRLMYAESGGALPFLAAFGSLGGSQWT